MKNIFYVINTIHMIKKLFSGIFLGLIAFGALYLYFLYAGDPSAVRTWIQTYPQYTAIFFVSAVLLYAFQGGNKIFKFLMFVIVVINLFILGDVFFRNNIGLDSGQFLTLFGLVLLALAITYITHRVRYIFMGIVGIGIAFVLLTGVLPLYNTMPSINDFILSQKAKIINQGINSDGILTIKNALGSKQISLKDLKKNDIDLSQKTQISFASKTQSGLEKVFIDLGNGSFVNINPQSAITLEQSGGNTIMQILQGNIEYYIPSELSGARQLIGKYKGKNIQEIQNGVRSDLVGQFEQKKEDFFINQIGGSIVLNPAINKVIKFFINTLYSISPKTYQKNLTNYNNIQQYFGISTTGSTSSTTTGESIKNLFDDLMSQAKRGAEETTVLKQFLQ
ncbi:MAG: hypothetical protein NT085_04260 [candidate division SR1 bacterium]|nr:hypothetical protein [candidate division SR1 bacterium]